MAVLKAEKRNQNAYDFKLLLQWWLCKIQFSVILQIASQMLFRGYVKLEESSPGIIRQLPLSFPNKILKVAIQGMGCWYWISVVSVN